MSNPFNNYEEQAVPKGRHWRDNFDSRFLRVFWLAGKPRVVTIVAVERLRSSNKKESKLQLLITLAEAEKKWASNVTNCGIIEALTGKSDPNDWIGTRIELYPTKTRDPNQQLVDCIRVREKLPAASAKTEAPRYRQEVSQYLHEMKAAATLEALDEIFKRVHADEALDAAERLVLVRGSERRQEQIANEVKP